MATHTRKTKLSLHKTASEADAAHEVLCQVLAEGIQEKRDPASLASLLAVLKTRRDLFLQTNRNYESALERAGHTEQVRNVKCRRRETFKECYELISSINNLLFELGLSEVSNLDPNDFPSMRSIHLRSSSPANEGSRELSDLQLSSVREEDEEEASEEEKVEAKAEESHQQRKHPLLDAATVHLIRANLMTAPPLPFKGDIGMYPSWEANLKSRMRGLNLTPLEELQVLDANTTGEPQEYIQRSLRMAMGANAGSVLAVVWETIKDRYGSEMLQATHMAEQLRNFPNIAPRNRSALRKFLDLISVATTFLGDTNMLHEFSSPRSLKQLADKLPEYMQYKWQDKIGKICVAGRNPPSLAMFKEFLKEQERVTTNPFYTPQAEEKKHGTTRVMLTDTEENGLPVSRDQPEYTLATTNVKVNPGEGRNWQPGNYRPPRKTYGCILHKTDSHKTEDCRTFETLTYEKKKRLIGDSRACYRCLGDHFARTCSSQVVCAHCQGNHLTVLHRSTYQPPESRNEIVSSARTACHNTAAKAFSKTLLVEVTSKHSPTTVRCYAIIDEQSTRCFADPALMEKLGISAIPWTYNVKTLSGLSSEVTGHSITGLMVRGVREQRWHELPSTLTNANIPDTSDEVATPSDVRKQGHVAHFAHLFCERDQEVHPMLLIGMDAGSVMGSQDYGRRYPFACKTALGWALLGPSQDHQGELQPKAMRTSLMDSQEHHFVVRSGGPAYEKDRSEVFEEHDDDDCDGFIILGNDDSILPALEEYAALWSQSYRHRLHLSYRPVFFPEGWQLVNLYEKCVTEKLFLPWALPELDAVVYLDTDHVFMRPPEHLTRHFRLFNEQQVLGAPPVNGFYLQYTTEIPFYGKEGLSSGLLLANLTRWRRLPFQWQPLVTSVARAFREGILGDQAIFNIIFSEYPEYIYDLSCDWSGNIEQCLTSNWNCSSIQDTGFSLVHGARHRFFPDQFTRDKIFSLPMHEIFQAWQRHQPGQPVSLLLRQMMHSLHIREDEIRNIKNNTRTHQFCAYSIKKLLKQMAEYVHEYEGLQINTE